MQTQANPPQLVEEVGPDHFAYYLHPGQERALDSLKRFVLVLAGTQGGKTSFGPLWLAEEIRRRGPGDYMVVTPTYPLLNLKALPEFLAHFKRRLDLGDYNGQARTFAYHDGSVRVLFGHASDPDSLESATAKAAWLDEAGQKKFRLGSWEAVQRRLAVHQGRALITTTPYDLGWLKQKLFDPWEAAGRNHPDIDVISFASVANPAFPRAEYERARQSLPGWKFRMFYEGRFERPAGLIYDCFDSTLHKGPRFSIPPKWPRYVGLDFGGVNTAAVFFAGEMAADKPTGKLIAYREYKAGGRTAKEHARTILESEPGVPICVGGSGSEQQWRDEFCAAGLPVREPAVTGADSVEVGINRVYGAVKRGEVLVFDDLYGVLDELGSYSRELDDFGEPTEKIADKETFHYLDSIRYIVGYLKTDIGAFGPFTAPTDRSVADLGERAGVWGAGEGPSPWD